MRLHNVCDMLSAGLTEHAGENGVLLSVAVEIGSLW